MSKGSTGAGATGFAAALRVREFRALWAADAMSMAGDQFARVALSVLVYDRTRSTIATAGVYALTFLPTLVGGILLSGVADRWSRKRVMVGTDVARAALLAAMAIPAVPLWGLCVLLVLAVLLGAPFRAAQTAVLPDVLPGEELYAAGIALRSTTLQIGMLAGYGLGGLVIAVVDPHVGLLVDGATFALSALLLAVEVKARPVPEAVTAGGAVGSRARWWADLRGGIGVLGGSPQIRLALGLMLLAGFYIAAEGLAAPYAFAFGGGPRATGLLLAADPAGNALGAWLFVRFVPGVQRDRWMGWLAVVPGLALAACAFRPGLGGSWLLWALSGMFAAYQVQATVVVVRHVPEFRRGQVMGLVSAALLTCQGLGALAAGALGEWIGVVDAVAVAGAVGALTATVLAWRWARTVRGAARHGVVQAQVG